VLDSDLADQTVPDAAMGTPSRADGILLANAHEGLETSYLASRLRRGEAATILHIVRDGARLRFVADMVAFFAPEIEIVEIPAWDCLPYDRISPSAGVMAERLRALVRLAGGPGRQKRLILTTANAVVQKVPPPDRVRAAHLRARAGARVDRDALVAYLERNGYHRTSAVVEAGDYAVRGGLVDVFPSGFEQPVRLDFFGSTLESIRTFDPLTQRSQSRVDALELMPVSEVLLDAGAIESFKSGYLRRFGAVTGDPLLESVEAGRVFPGMEHWLPLFHADLVPLTAYLDDEAEVGLDHLARDAIKARAALIGEHYEARLQAPPPGTSFGAASYRPLPPELLYLDEGGIERELAPRTRLEFSVFGPPPHPPADGARIQDLAGRPSRDFALERANRAINLFDAIVTHLETLVAGGERPLIAAHSEGTLERLRQVLTDHGFDRLTRVRHWAEVPEVGGAAIAVLPAERGFSAPAIHVIGERDLLGDRLTAAAKRSRKAADRFVQDVAALSEGDLVVHAEHGIGRFDGLETLEVGGAPHDCLRLLYQGGDKLFVPVENLDVLSRYGHADQEAALDRLGGVGWQSRKAKVKERIRELAGELINVAAERALRKGTVLDLPHGVYEEFAARFPYEETDDQLAAIEAVLEDMASGRPMDRLLCGDVGFGKTEVALRAAFVAAMAGKQVALLAPTTLLVRQHYSVFTQRFEGLPVRVAQLSRFVTAKEASEVKKELAAGRIEIVIGTHALLGKGVEFKNLGLVVVDEEQHFGVAHKEKLKQLRAEVHVLTMTATPIPRTLHMALGGMRDLSIIATPPIDRLAVRTFIMPADPVVLREALMRERYRGGQSFFVCPRISDQGRLRQDLEKLVPELKLAIANGQMPAADLDRVMGDFYDRKLDLLIATNIIESGLDIPTANTLIVHRADQFGLAQLYQLRGRVGRSKVRGYAYFTVPSNKALADAAERRLAVIQSLEGLGAGFQLASHDLDIRGAGNLLGEEQSGQIREVGFELYNHMLEEAVAELRAKAVAEPVEAPSDWRPQITIDAAAMMPESFIGDLDLRLAMYRRLAGLATPEELEAFAAELIDRFGKLPPETEQLLQLVAIKQLCRKANVAKLDAGPKGIVLAFHENRFARPERLIRLIAESKGQMKVRPDHKVVVLRETKSPTERLKTAKTLMGELAQLAA
jgi:transcription-repair coupling factor (superfamily II helicase)